MKSVSSMVFFKLFTKTTFENGLYYGENGSSRFSNRLYYGENDKKRVFLRLFWRPKKQKTRPQELKSVAELMEDPLCDLKHSIFRQPNINRYYFHSNGINLNLYHIIPFSWLYNPNLCFFFVDLYKLSQKFVVKSLLNNTFECSFCLQHDFI